MRYFITIGIILLSIVCGACIIQKHDAGDNNKAIAYFREGSMRFYKATNELLQAVELIDGTHAATILHAREALKESRLQYKSISFFLDYYFPHQSWFYNAPAKYEVEEPYMEYEEPHGLQQIEALLYDSLAANNKQKIIDQVKVLNESAADLPTLLIDFNCTQAGMMEAARVELIRVMALYIEGYDAPFLKTGIAESVQSLSALQTITGLYAVPGTRDTMLLHQFRLAIGYLQKHKDFDAFDRLSFFTKYAISLENELRFFIKEKGWGMSSYGQLNYEAGLFDGEVLPIQSRDTRMMAAVGEKLFFDKSLSGNLTRSCASCHQPDKYFADGFPKNKNIDNDSLLKRNTPSLFYAAYQSVQFWDGRAKDLPSQIIDVLNNKHEMGSSSEKVEAFVNNSQSYRDFFAKAKQSDTNKSITANDVANAIASYIQTLAPMCSPFDAYIKGNRKAMTPLQVKGFNLFAGKAQCATCHFIPLFNGATPPFFDKSEYEVLGTPASDDFNHVVSDTDSGRYAYFPILFYNAAFKTPTVRNAAKTAPYMHNGGFSSLHKVIEFYNLGGGAGLNMSIDHQTLSTKPLRLTKAEMAAIESFILALTDTLEMGKP